MANILTAIKTICESSSLTIEKITNGNNVMNDMGEGLEIFIQKAFSESFAVKEKKQKIELMSKTFSYLGNKNNPPDMILNKGDAIEVKKIQSKNSNLQLNSSHPKNKLYSTNKKLNKACVNCENWKEKDIIYIVGHVPKKTELKTLWMVYGDCYAADEETYTKIENKITDNINTIQDIEINESTNELSGVKNVDPLNITYLRVRGMWIILHPQKVFDYLYEYDEIAAFQLIALIREEKYCSLPDKDRLYLEGTTSINIETVQIKNPNNPAKTIDAKLITYKKTINK